MNNSPCEYCGAALPFGVDKPTRRVRSHHFQNCSMRPQREAVEQPRREWVSLTEEEMHGLYRRAGLEAYYPRDGAVQYEYERRFDAYARAIEQACKEKNHE
jgi:hypothetical protein